MSPPTFADVRNAADRIRPFVHRTPVMTCSMLDELAGRELVFKCELFQKTGSFKFRGATNAVQALSVEAASRGVITHSSGNHGQALALAAQMRGIPATIIMPRSSSPVKKAAVAGYGATVVESGPSSPEREAAVAKIQKETGATLIPPFDHNDVIAGQGTAALELLEDVAGIDGVLAPVGGGGLLAGWTLAAKGMNPRLRVDGAEPATASDAAQSLQKKQIVRLEKVTSIADGLLTNYLGERTFPIIRDGVAAIHLVSEDEIIAAMRLVWERMKLVIEPSAAVGVAVALAPAFKSVPGKRLGIVLCGGNIALDQLPWQRPTASL
ncbi:MAG: pyridoxal-phosphate dependent enzyme [Gemmataceae bacterium]